MHRSVVLTVGVAVLFAAMQTGCSGEPEAGQAVQSPVSQGVKLSRNGAGEPGKPADRPPQGPVSFTGEFTEHQALEAIFGRFDPDRQGFKWSPKELCARDTLMQSVPDGEDGGHIGSFMSNLVHPENKNVARGHSISKFQVDGSDFVYFVFQTETSWCIGCPALVGASKWGRSGDKWTLVSAEKCLAPLGAMGAYDGKELLVKLGPQRYGILLRHDFNDWQESLIIAEAPTGSLRVAFAKITGDGNTQGPSSCAEVKLMGRDLPCWKYESTLRFEPGHNPDYYNLIVRRRGTLIEGENELSPIDAEETYSFVDGVYR